MPRLARENIDTPFLHIMVQGVNKEYVFKEEEDKEKYLKLLKQGTKKHSLEILAYCIMDNHAHILAYAVDKKQLSSLMRSTNWKYAIYFNKKYNRTGTLFRGRYETEGICKKSYLINCINYIQYNPVKAGIVESCQDYKYSTFNDYAENKGVRTAKILEKIFGKNYDYHIIFDKYNENVKFKDVD